MPEKLVGTLRPSYFARSSKSLSLENPDINKTSIWPTAKKEAEKKSIHNQELIDNYSWLRFRENPEVVEHLNAENRYAEDGLKSIKELRADLFEEIKSRIAQNDSSVPYQSNGYTYYQRYEEGWEYPIFCRKADFNDAEEIMVNANTEAADHSYYHLASLDVSSGNQLIAFGEDLTGRRIYTLRFKDLRTGELLADHLKGTTGNTVWAADDKTVFYTVQDDSTLRAYQIYRHTLGTDQAADELIYEEHDDTFYCQVFLSKSRAYVFVESRSTLTSEVRFMPADEPLSGLKIFAERQRGRDYSIEHLEETFYIRHNAAGADNFQVSKTPIDATGSENWTDVIPHRSAFFIEDFELFSDYMVVEERKNGLVQLRVIPWSQPEEEYYVSFDEPAFLVHISTNEELGTAILRFGYSSLTTPLSIYDYDMASKRRELKKRQPVLGDFDHEEYTSERIFADGRDGTKIPVSIVYRKDFQRNGESPLLLYGYGSYGLSLDAYFSSPRLSLLDRGFAFAIAHIRGGQEMGRSWYEDGKLLKKKNTFYDFIDSAVFLIKHQYTSTDHLYAMGGSAGGLLMGAVANMRPDLWNGIVAQVAFVDVVNTMLDETIPLTTGEYDEWGNPNEPTYFEYIKSYSPYDNVIAQDYPAMLVTTGLHDSQVQYWEPAKWVAKLRELRTNDRPLYLVTNMDAGHGGASGRFEKYREVALEYAFLIMLET